MEIRHLFKTNDFIVGLFLCPFVYPTSLKQLFDNIPQVICIILTLQQISPKSRIWS